VTSSIGPPPNGEEVTFKQGSTTLGTGILSGGVATVSTSALGVGSKTITAVYAGDANFTSSTSPSISQVIGKEPTTTGLISSQNPSSPGTSVTFTATVSPQFGGTATGSVVFKNGTATLGTVTVSNGTASYTTSKLTAGAHNITSTYNGNSVLASSSAALTQTVN
jgi:Big-like domain-containing protein